MVFFNRNKKVKCEICGTQTTRLSLAHHKKRFSARSFSFSSCTNFSTKSRAELNYHIAKKHSKATASVVRKCKIYDEDFHSFYNLRDHKRKEHGAQRDQELKILMKHTQWETLMTIA